MGLPCIHCVVCGGPFGSPYDDLMEGRYPDAGHVESITFEELQWLDDIQLFGLRSALPTFHGGTPDDHPRSDPKEMPVFIENVHYNYGAETIFRVRGIGDVTTLCPNKNGDCLFAMHGACATIVRKVCAGRTTYISLRAYYEVLISAIPYYYDQGGIYWPHDYFGALTYWGYDEWDYHEGFRKFVTNPLEISKTTTFVSEILEAAPAPQLSSEDATATIGLPQAVDTTTTALSKKLSPLESLPAELIEQISDNVPNRTLFALRLTSRALAHRLSWSQRICYRRMINGVSMPHLWNLEPGAFTTFQRYLKGQLKDSEQQNWKYLTTLFADARTIVRKDPEHEAIPLELWNRCRIWECVVGVKKFKRSSD